MRDLPIPSHVLGYTGISYLHCPQLSARNWLSTLQNAVRITIVVVGFLQKILKFRFRMEWRWIARRDFVKNHRRLCSWIDPKNSSYQVDRNNFESLKTKLFITNTQRDAIWNNLYRQAIYRFNFGFSNASLHFCTWAFNLFSWFNLKCNLSRIFDFDNLQFGIDL